MNARTGIALACSVLAWAVFVPPSFSADLSGNDRDVIKEMTRGIMYLRNNVPCRVRSGAWGIGAEPITEVSPSSVDWDRNLKLIEGQTTGKRRFGVDTVSWLFGPNDGIQYAKLYFKPNGVVDLYAEGVKPKKEEVWIRFVDINSKDDFQKAFDVILSNKPLQDEHPDWPDDIRHAIAQRKVIAGMTKAQAFAVVGTPIGAESKDEGGQKVETWFPRQDTGTTGSYRKVIGGATGFPVSIRFVDGKVQSTSDKLQPVHIDK